MGVEDGLKFQNFWKIDIRKDVANVGLITSAIRIAIGLNMICGCSS